MRAFQLFFSVDPSLGRVDYSSMSDQALMEMLIEGFDDETKKEYQDTDGMYRDVCEWQSFQCDEDHRVIEVSIASCYVIGSLELCYVPPKMKLLNISPWNGKGELTGSADLTHLPEGMESLSLNNNTLTGEIDLTSLPDGMIHLYLCNNYFTGEIDLTQLPHRMTTLFLNNNQLSGSLVIKNLPPKMGLIDLQVNQFNAMAMVDLKTPTIIKLRGSGVTSVVDENGEKADMKRV